MASLLTAGSLACKVCGKESCVIPTLDTQLLVELLWTRDQPKAEISIWQYTTLTRVRYPCPGGIQTCDLSERGSATGTSLFSI